VCYVAEVRRTGNNPRFPLKSTTATQTNFARSLVASQQVSLFTCGHIKIMTAWQHNGRVSDLRLQGCEFDKLLSVDR